MRRHLYSPAMAGALLAAALAATPTFAQDITVTAERRPETVTNTLADVTVITAEDIQRSPQETLPSILLNLANANIVQNGGEGSQATVGLRGTAATQTLVLVNGLRQSSATAGTTAIADIPLRDV